MHLVLLLRRDAQVGAPFPRAGQDESRLAIRREVNQGIRLVHFASIFQSGERRVPDVLVRLDPD